MRKGKVFNMQESIVNKSLRQGIFRRVLVALWPWQQYSR